MLQFKNLKQVFTTFSDEQKCRDFLVQQRWSGSPVCPYCNSNKWYSIENGKRFKCGNKECYKKYSVTVGSIFHASNIPLTTWFPAMWLIINHKKGISSCQIARDLGVTQKTAWFMLHRIRESLKNKKSPMLQNIVELDELYVGARRKNLSNKRRAELRESSNNMDYKTMVIGMLERGGDLRLEVAGDPTNKSNIHTIVNKNVDKSSQIMTDGDPTYISIGQLFVSHYSVNHTTHEFVRDNIIHTNTIEGAFGLFRRSIIGVYHRMSPKHLSRYCQEMQYRYNTRETKDGQRFENTLGRVEARLSWKELTKETELTAKAIISPEVPEIKIGIQGKKKAIYQLLNGKIIAQFPSIVEASRITGLKSYNISDCLRGQQKTTGGYEWKYV